MSLHLRQAVPSGISFLTIVIVRIGTAGAGWALLKPCGPASKCSCTASQNSSGHSPPCLAAVAAGAEAKGRASHVGLAGLALCGRRAARARASVGGRIAAAVAEPLRAAPPRGASRAAVGHIFPGAECRCSVWGPDEPLDDGVWAGRRRLPRLSRAVTGGVWEVLGVGRATEELSVRACGTLQRQGALRSIPAFV